MPEFCQWHLHVSGISTNEAVFVFRSLGARVRSLVTSGRRQQTDTVPVPSAEEDDTADCKMKQQGKMNTRRNNTSSQRRCVCLFGTSANPPTGDGGHVGIVRALEALSRDELLFDEIRILPVYHHPFSV